MAAATSARRGFADSGAGGVSEDEVLGFVASTTGVAAEVVLVEALVDAATESYAESLAILSRDRDSTPRSWEISLNLASATRGLFTAAGITAAGAEDIADRGVEMRAGDEVVKGSELGSLV